MAFYKLYKKLHRRTDTRDLMIMIDRQIMRQELYKKKSKEARAALARFMAAGALISSMDINSMYPEFRKEN